MLLVERVINVNKGVTFKYYNPMNGYGIELW